MIVAGFGFRQGAGMDSLRDALTRATPGADPTVIATLTEKAGSPALTELAQSTKAIVVAVAPEDLREQTTLTQSAKSIERHGTGSVAEAAALAAAGPGARLLGPRQISTDRMATCAIAQGVTP